MYIKEPIELVAEFISPFEDNLTVVFIGDNLDDKTTWEFKRQISQVRYTLPVTMPEPNFLTSSVSSLYRGKLTDTLTPHNCVTIFDQNTSLNVINYLTNSSTDQLEDMLIDKFLIQHPQEKYIFDISNTPDDTLAKFLSTMDDKIGAFNYLIIQDYLAIILVYVDDFADPFTLQ